MPSGRRVESYVRILSVPVMCVVERNNTSSSWVQRLMMVNEQGERGSTQIRTHPLARTRTLIPPHFPVSSSSPPIMPLEATMMIIDNSEFMRNGDYQPNRFEAQSDAVNTVFQTKIDANPENTVGIMTMAGKG